MSTPSAKDFQNPDSVSAGNILNLPERDEDGNLIRKSRYERLMEDIKLFEERPHLV